MPLRIRASCPLCGSEQKTALTALPFDGPDVSAFLARYYSGRVDMTILKDSRYAIDHCGTCGGMWQREILNDDEMEKLYGEWISPEHSRSRRANPVLSLQYARHAARLTRLLPEPDKRLLLDYGMGWGDWCRMMQAFGFRVHGVELSGERLTHAKGLGIPCSGPDELPDGPFDFIYLEQVLEHVPDPKALMTTLTAHLTPSGCIHVGVPNGRWVRAAAGDPKRLLKKGAAQPLEHINIFTPKSLRLFMASFGCKPAAQKEGLLRVSPPSQFLSDLLLAAARFLSPKVFPNGTSVLFRKSA